MNSQEEIGRHDTLTGNKLLFGAIQSIICIPKIRLLIERHYNERNNPLPLCHCLVTPTKIKTKKKETLNKAAILLQDSSRGCVVSGTKDTCQHATV